MVASNRIWVLAGSLIIVVVLALAGLLGIKPQLDAAQSSDTQRVGVESLNAQHRVDLAALKDEFTRLPEISAEVSELRKSVPASVDLDSVIADLAAMQGTYGVTITSYNAQSPTPFVPAESLVPLVPATVNASNFLSIQIDITVDGTRDATLAFIKGLQTNSRLYFITNISVAPEGGSSVSALVYVLLDTPLVDPNEVPAPAVDATASE